MAKFGLPTAVQNLIWHQLPSIDHVAVLLAVRAAPQSDLAAVSERAMVTPALATVILHELVQRQLLVRHESHYRLVSDDALEDAVGQLAEMYNSRPVTLVRAIYDRPAKVLQQFSDAFRLRREEDA